MSRFQLLLFTGVLFCLALFGCSDSNPDSRPTDGDDSTLDGDIITDGDTEDSPDGDLIEDGDSEQAAPMSRLHAENTKILNEAGEEVLLKGVNLGGLFYNETWITLIDHIVHTRVFALGRERGIEEDVRNVLENIGPTRRGAMLPIADESEWLASLETGLTERIGADQSAAFMSALAAFLPDIYDDSDKPLYQLLETRFGIETRDELMDTFMDAWITESDIAWLADQGFNLVRVPIGYRALFSGSHMDHPSELIWNEATIENIHNLLDWCESHGVYAVIDIQEAPGAQNDYSGEPILYVNEQMQQFTVQLWERFSDEFKDRNVVAAYSLLAEPMGAPSVRARDELYDKLVKAIRAKGDDHLLVIHDGFFGMNSLPVPSEYEWEQVVYSTHIFEWAAVELQDVKNALGFYDLFYHDAQAKQNVPYFMGSYSVIWDEQWAYDALSYMRDWFDQYGWGWSLWTYKRIDDPIEKDIWNLNTSWGLRGRLADVSTFERVDVFQDSAETIEAKFRSYETITLDPNQNLLDRIAPNIYMNAQ